ncbi:hypothetical protein [Glycomyces algeriensis]|uniref:Uncharacterized protein n=1 Tax=Glycomyces algeriensis TaxID=256037 RepID=A0A9W6G552_9ACTN|nr:hypothetical protein [Glycomyces algeriensis]MDA1366835.1 hypothetical protein [Glycomyces algeriensis]MDR7352780.1 hypothetical protein [Glycomyces algeriensis]GLI40463.1 hypothetical protein GALLR39Z86_03130 [Glycomyces algeriensis]
MKAPNMAPLSDLPPMPPVPDDELNPSRRQGAAATAQDESNRYLVVVRFNRRLLGWAVSVGWSLTALMYALTFYLMASSDISAGGFIFLVQFLPLHSAIVATYLLTQRHCLTYDLRRRRVAGGVLQVNSALKQWRDGDRLEYSIHRGRLEIVRPNGRRRNVVRNAFTIDQRSWTAFVDVYLAHQNAWKESEGTESIPEVRMPAAPPGKPGAMINVGVRWRFFGIILLIGLAYIAADLALLADADRRGAEFDFFGTLMLTGGGCALFGTVPLVCNPVVTYEPGKGRVSVKPRGLPAREFPRPGGERIEYSIYNGALYEIRLDGKRRRVATGWAREQVAWKTFVDRFLEDHNPTGPRS